MGMIDNMKKVPVYVNKPIDEDELDYLGFEPYANHIYSALDKSNTIGIIGDFGTGKSSLIEYLKNKYLKHEFSVASINLWSAEKRKNDDNIGIHAHFLYQLALSLTSRSFSKMVNRKVNSNYGFLSFNINTFSGIFLVLAFISFLFYVILKPEGLTWVECFVHATKAGMALCFSLLCLIIGIFKANIIISSGKNENKRNINSNEIIELYKDILKHTSCGRACKWKKNKDKLVIIIEDLDRSSDLQSAYIFLQELNRYYINSLSDDELGKVKFIVNIRPEKEFVKEEDASIYSKIFDYTIDLFPISNSNFDIVLDNLLNEQKEGLNKIGIQVFEKENVKKIRGMKRIVYGKNITLRDVKERLNCAILLYNSLRSNATDKMNIVSFEKCAFVAYLKNTYPSQYLKIYKNSEFEKVIFNYAVNNKETDYDLEAALVGAFEGNDLEFIDELKNGIMEKLIDTSYKMYFYNYPKGAHIRSLSEGIVYDTIMYDQEYTMDFDASLSEAILLNSKIISDTYEERRTLTNILPKVTFKNGLLFEHCIMNYKEDVFIMLESLLAFDNISINKSKIVLDDLFSLNLQDLNWNNLIVDCAEEFKKMFTNKFENIDEQNILVIRKTILNYFANQILSFDYLFAEGYPAILEEEVEKISDINIVLKMCLIQPIEVETFKAVHRIIMNNGIDEEVFDLVMKLYDNIAISIKNEEEVGKIFFSFAENIRKTSIEMEAYLFNLSEINKNFKEIYIKMLNITNGSGAEKVTVVDHIEKLNITSGLNIPTIEQLLIGRNNQLYTSNLLHSDYSVKNIIFNKGIIENEIPKLYSNGEEMVVLKLRKKVLEDAKKGNNVLEEFNFLFQKPLPTITQDELLYISKIEDALELIDHKQISLEDVNYIAEYINQKGIRHPGLVHKVLTMIVETDNTTAQKLFKLLDFNAVKYKAVSEQKREQFISSIETEFDLLSNKQEIINFLKHIKYLEKYLEKRLLGGLSKAESEAYAELLNESDMNEIDDVTINVLATSGYYNVYNKDVQMKLFEYEQYDRYIYAQTMQNKSFVFEKGKLDLLRDSYVEMLKKGNLSEIHRKMFDNKEFADYAVNEKIYLELNDNMLLYFVTGKQNREIFEYIFTKDDDFVINYLSQITSITDREAEEFLLSKFEERETIFLTDSVYKNLRKCITDNDIKNKYKNKREYRRRKRRIKL